MNRFRPAHTHTPESHVSESHVPELVLPELKFSELYISETHAPELDFSESHAPELDFSESHAPESHIKKSHAPESHIKKSYAPELDFPELDFSELHFPESCASESCASESCASESSISDSPKSFRFVCISDTHGDHRLLNMPEGDILLHAGDFSKFGKEEHFIDFFQWLTELPYRLKIIIAGNHDLMMDEIFYEKHWYQYHKRMQNASRMKQIFTAHSRNDIIYLEDSSYEIQPGLIVHGTPWQPLYSSSAFQMNEKKLFSKWKLIPSNCDILITHGPPFGFNDLSCKGRHGGSWSLCQEVQQRIKPRVHLFGHIHEGYGLCVDENTTYINASFRTVNRGYYNQPIIFDLPIDKSLPPNNI